MRRSIGFSVVSGLVLAFLGLSSLRTPAGEKRERNTTVKQPAASGRGLTCNANRLNPKSADLVFQENGAIWTHATTSKYTFFPQKLFNEQLRMTLAATRNAEEAKDLDPANLAAHVLLARYYLVYRDTYADAKREWRHLFKNGRGVTFDTVIYNLDNKRMFLAVIGPTGIAFYRYGLFGVNKMGFPDVRENPLFWRAEAGCIPETVHPTGVMSWAWVTEMKSKNWVQEIRLNRRLELESDRGKKKAVDKLKVAFLGGIGHMDVVLDWYKILQGDFAIEQYAYGPADYNARLRNVIIALVDPDGRIKLPKPSHSGVGW